MNLLIFSLKTIQIVWIALVAAILLAGIIILFVFIFKRNNDAKRYKYNYYKKIYNIVLNNDYFLLNNFEFKIDEKTKARIDHVIYGDKYIYLINDYYYPGELTGKEKDPSLIYQTKKGDKNYTENPIITSRKIISYLSILTGLDPSIFIGIGLTNADSKHSIESNSTQCFVIQVNRLKKLIKTIESRQIGKISEKDMMRIVNATKDLSHKLQK